MAKTRAMSRISKAYPKLEKSIQQKKSNEVKKIKPTASKLQSKDERNQNINQLLALCRPLSIRLTRIRDVLNGKYIVAN